MRGGVETNAAWCEAICRAGGLSPSRTAEVWNVVERSPDGYPDVVTLRSGLGADFVLAGIDLGAGCSVKDSFSDIDLSEHHFEVLFEATWIYLLGRSAPPNAAHGWAELVTVDGIGGWLTARDIDVDPEVLWLDQSVRFFAASTTGAGFALTQTREAAGVSCVLYGSADPAATWADVVSTATRHIGGRALVGYERDSDLDHALAGGFEAAGPLRIWMHD